MDIAEFYIEPATYAADATDLRAIRESVFVVEQRVPAELEFDELDPQCHHVLVRDLQYRPIATGRLSPEGKLGRIAVLPEWRHRGVGRSILLALIDKARNLGLTSVCANAQVAALDFYRKLEFVEEGQPFVEAGIPHQRVRLSLPASADVERPLAIPSDPSVEAVKFDSFESTFAATLELIAQARRQLLIYSHDLEHALYGKDEVVQALKQFALGSRNAVVQIIIQDLGNLGNRQHPMLDLAQRLPSRLVLRTPLESEDLQYPSAFVANDRDGYLFRLLNDRYQGHWSPNLPSRSRPLREEFDRVWQRSRPCTEFRVLGL